MSNPKTKEAIKAHKTEVLSNFSAYLDTLIESSDTVDVKRVDLISYWLKDFQQYLIQEKTFDASKIKSYKRGDVVKVNLGFNVGSEQGGLRYAIILDKDNKHNAKTVTVIPLASQKEGKLVNERDIHLGTELYNRLKAKYDSIKEDLNTQRANVEAELKRLKDYRNAITHLTDSGNNPPELTALLDEFDNHFNDMQSALKGFEEKEISLKKINIELHKMKEGSVAKIEQITTISKQRIFDPKKSADVLAGIRFSEAAMNKINEKIKELYIF